MINENEPSAGQERGSPRARSCGGGCGGGGGDPVGQEDDRRRWLTTAQALRVIEAIFAEWAAAIDDMRPLVGLPERVALERERCDLKAIERQIRADVRRTAYRQHTKDQIRARDRARALRKKEKKGC